MDANLDSKKEIDLFLKLYQAESGEKITTPAHGNLALKKHKAPNMLPIRNDLLVLRNYLIEQIKTQTDEVLKHANQEYFRHLSEVSLARLIMFNKRRGNAHKSTYIWSKYIHLILIANLIDHNEKDDSMHILSECIAGSKEKHLRA